MKKIILPHIDIYTPETKFKLSVNDDFDIEHFLHYPIIVNDDGSLWKDGNLYILSKLKEYIKPSYSYLDSIAKDLKDFKQWCDNENIDYLKASRKVLRPTYMYRYYLQDELKKGNVSPNTIKRKISNVIGFYKYLIDIEGIKFDFPLWESSFSSITLKNRYGQRYYKEVETTDIGKVVSRSNPDLYDDFIQDGGRLSPLTVNQQVIVFQSLKALKNIEMTLGFLISITTGARIQTTYTLRLKHFERDVSTEEKEVKIKVGLGSDCDTKYDKQHILFMPVWVYNKVKTYISSHRAKTRRNKSKHIFDQESLQYVFLSSRGIPIYAAKDDPYSFLYRTPPNGAAVRQFILGTLKDEICSRGYSFTFSFHDLRASFGMNLVDNLYTNQELEITKILFYIKERMGHSSLITTELYLNFREKHKIKIEAQKNFENYIFELLNE